MAREPKTSRRELTPYERGQIVGASAAGLNNRAIVRLFGDKFSRTTVREAIRKAETRKDGKSLPRSGRPRKNPEQNPPLKRKGVRKTPVKRVGGGGAAAGAGAASSSAQGSPAQAEQGQSQGLGLAQAQGQEGSDGDNGYNNNNGAGPQQARSQASLPPVPTPVLSWTPAGAMAAFVHNSSPQAQTASGTLGRPLWAAAGAGGGEPQRDGSISEDVQSAHSFESGRTADSNAESSHIGNERASPEEAQTSREEPSGL